LSLLIPRSLRGRDHNSGGQKHNQQAKCSVRHAAIICRQWSSTTAHAIRIVSIGCFHPVGGILEQCDDSAWCFRSMEREESLTVYSELELATNLEETRPPWPPSCCRHTERRPCIRSPPTRRRLCGSSSGCEPRGVPVGIRLARG